MKRALILTVTAGNAHNACAKAMQNELANRGVTVKTVDILKSYSTKLNAWVADKGYSVAVSKLPKIYNAFYERYKNKDSAERYSCAAQGVALSVLKGLLKGILSFKPDVVYCTHFYGAIALTDLQLLYKLPCKCVATALDYVNSPFWEAGIGVDYFAIPNEDFIDEFLFEGYEHKQLLPLGLPVDGRSLKALPKAEAAERLGLDANVFTVLVAFGGGMWRGAYRVFKSVLNAVEGKRAQIIVLNGKDKKSFKKIRKTKHGKDIKILNVGFTDGVPLYLSAADLAVGKLGGACATEMINAGLPMLVTENLPAQERHNLEYLKAKGVAVAFGNGEKLKELISEAYADGGVLQNMRENALKLKKNAAAELAEFMASLPDADYSEFNLSDKEIKTVKKRAKNALKIADFCERRRI